MAKQGSGNPPEQDKTFSTRQTEQYREDKKKLIAPFHGALVFLSIPRPNSTQEIDHCKLKQGFGCQHPRDAAFQHPTAPLSEAFLSCCSSCPTGSQWENQELWKRYKAISFFQFFCLLRKRKAKNTPGLGKLNTSWFLKCKLFGGKAKKTRYSLVSRFLHSCSWDGFLFLDYSGEGTTWKGPNIFNHKVQNKLPLGAEKEPLLQSLVTNSYNPSQRDQ